MTRRVGKQSTGICHARPHEAYNNPRRIYFTDGSQTRYKYSATGEKLRVIHQTAVPNITVPIGSARELAPSEIQCADSTDYFLSGNLTLRNGRIDKLQFEEGYCQAAAYSGNTSQDNFTFHYYDRDHLGNIRQVINAIGSTKGTVIQRMEYYPFGAQFCGGSADSNVQTRRYNGKEFDRMHGLNTYDYGARQYNPVTARWDRVDPLCEKYYDVSPYAYCGNNPINAIDIEGKDSYLIIWATQSDQYGHAAIGVDNYTWDTEEKRFLPNGTITVVGLFPDGDYGFLQAVKDESVGEKWYVDNIVTLDNLKSGSFCSNENDSPDGILRISTSYEIDCEVMKNISYEVNANKGYKGMSRNCSTFVREGIRVATNQNVKGEESYLGNSYVTPNRLFKDTEKLENTTVIKNPGKKTNFEFKDLINNTINKTNKKSK